MNTETKPAVGFIGIGNMGWPMATHIVEAGYSLTVFDLDKEHAAKFAKQTGAKATDSLKTLAEVDIVVTMLPTGPIVREVLVNAEGGAFIDNARPGTIVIDMSSSEPTGTQALGKILEEKGITLLDAPVSGAVPRAKLGNLTIMIGGDDADLISKVKPLLQTMGEQLFDAGKLGSGHAVKALNNYIAASAYTATAESLLIAERFGLDTKTLIDIVNVSTGRSFISEIVMEEHVLKENFGSGFGLGLLTKDVKIAADLGDAVNLDAPMSRLIRDRWALASKQLGYDADHTEAIKSWNEDLQDEKKGAAE